MEDTTITVAGHDYRVRTQPRTGEPDTQVQVVLDEAPAQGRRRAMLGVLVEAGLIGLVLTAVLGVWLGVRAVRPLQAALALQRRFVTDAGHELRTPLTLLSTRAQMLRRKLKRADTDEAAVTREVDSVVTDAGHLAAILDDLLLVADLRAPADATVDVVELVAAVVDAARPVAAQSGVTIELAAPERAAVRGAEAGIRRAVTAVVDNAVRHAATRVGVVVTATSTQVVVEITDDGPALTPGAAEGSSRGSRPPAYSDPTRPGGTGSASRWSAMSSTATAGPSPPATCPTAGRCSASLCRRQPAAASVIRAVRLREERGRRALPRRA